VLPNHDCCLPLLAAGEGKVEGGIQSRRLSTRASPAAPPRRRRRPQPSRVTLILKVNSPIESSVRDTRRAARRLARAQFARCSPCVA
jgi:hypothetical protein